VARARDLTADARDRTALARDAVADARDASAENRERYAGRANEIRTGQVALNKGASLSAGLAELCAGDSLESLLARADTDLYRSRTGR
jgi:hypothetical protein